MAADFPYLYPDTFAEARRQNEVELWRTSYRENCACKEAIEDAVRHGFDGMHLDKSCVNEVLEQYGYKRTAHVLTATLQSKSYDGRFSPDNKKWASDTHILNDPHNIDFVINTHPAVLDGFVDIFRSEMDALHLFGAEDCDTIWQELEGKILVMKPGTFKESYWSPENQLWYAEDGFGCSPTASGRAVYATCLGDGENHVRWNREDFIGVIRDDRLPDWAREQLAKLRSGQEIGPVSPNHTQELTR